MVRFDYQTEKFQKVSVCGIPCNFSDVRIDRSTVPKARYQYDEGQGDPVRVGYGIMVNFF